MIREPWRDEWRRAILKEPRISNACRVLMIVLADAMTADGQVRRSRAELAETLGVHASRITQRLNEAVELGILRRVIAGKPGQLAAYQAARPDGARVRTKRPRNEGFMRAHQDMVRRTGPSDGACVRTRTGEAAERGDGARVQSALSTEPQQSDAKVAVAAEHHPTPDLTVLASPDSSLRSPQRGEPPKAEDQERNEGSAAYRAGHAS